MHQFITAAAILAVWLIAGSVVAFFFGRLIRSMRGGL